MERPAADLVHDGLGLGGGGGLERAGPGGEHEPSLQAGPSDLGLRPFSGPVPALSLPLLDGWKGTNTEAFGGMSL